MFDDLDSLSSIDLSEVKNVDTPSNSGGYNKDKKYQKGNGSFFPKKEEVLEDAYIPVVIFVDRDFPPEVKNSLYNIASKLINKKITVRYNADDKDFHERISSLSDKFTEPFIPWKGFNEVDTKNYYNTITAKHIAQQHFQGWDKIPEGVRSLLARNVRMVFGGKNNSIALSIITWSKDGASKLAEFNKDTGRASFIIKLASTYGFPVINISKESSGNLLEKTFNI